MIQRRNDIGNVLAMEEDGDEGLSTFLRDFDIEKKCVSHFNQQTSGQLISHLTLSPETGSIVNLPAFDSEEWRQGKWRVGSSSEVCIQMRVYASAIAHHTYTGNPFLPLF
jgi:hypothetical protein